MLAFWWICDFAFFCSIILSNKSKSIPFFSWRLYEFCVCVCVFFFFISLLLALLVSASRRSLESFCSHFVCLFFFLFNASCLRNRTMWLLVHERQLKLIEKKEHRTCPNSLFLFVGGSFTLNGLFFVFAVSHYRVLVFAFQFHQQENGVKKKKWTKTKSANAHNRRNINMTRWLFSSRYLFCYLLFLFIYLANWNNVHLWFFFFFFQRWTCTYAFPFDIQNANFFFLCRLFICLLSIHERPGFDDGFFFSVHCVSLLTVPKWSNSRRE